MDIFPRSYIGTALWASTDSEGDPLDDRYNVNDLSNEAVERAVKDCDAFRQRAAKELSNVDLSDYREGQIAHDFWLTRNNHGAGFWDGDYPESVGQALTELAESFGECNLYVGDDGTIDID